MCDVRDEKSMGISGVGADADGCSAAGRIYRRMVDAKVDLAVVGIDQACCRSGGLGLIRDEPVCRVAAGVKVESGEKVSRVVGFDQVVRCCCIDGYRAQLRHVRCKGIRGWKVEVGG